MCTYFSTYKYHDFEDCSLSINGEPVGRKYFDCISIRNRDELINLISLAKNSILSHYIKLSLDEFNFQKNLSEIDESLSRIYIELNEKIEKSIGDIRIDYDYSSIWDIVQKSKIENDQGGSLSELTNLQLCSVLINLLGEIQGLEGNKLLVILRNVDSMFTVGEYRSVYELCRSQCSKYDTWFLFELFQSEYYKYSEKLLIGTTVINEIDFSMPEIERITDYVNQHYPIDIRFSTEQMGKLLSRCINTIGSQRYSSFGQSMVIDKIITESMGIKKEKLELPKSPEMAFLAR